jgi:ribosomal protein L19
MSRRSLPACRNASVRVPILDVLTAGLGVLAHDFVEVRFAPRSRLANGDCCGAEVRELPKDDTAVSATAASIEPGAKYAQLTPWLTATGHIPVLAPLPSAPTTGIKELLEAKNIKALDPHGTRAALFDKNAKSCLPIGSVLEVEMWDDFPAKTTFKSFAGHIIAVRRRGMDTSFRLRSIIQRLGVEQVFRLYSPTIKSIRIINRGALRGKRYKKAKIYYTREPNTRNTLGPVDAVVKQARLAEASVKAERESLLARIKATQELAEKTRAASASKTSKKGKKK